MKILGNIYSYIVTIVAGFSIMSWLKNKTTDTNTHLKAKPARKKRHSIVKENWVNGEYDSARSLLNDLDSRYKWLKGFKPRMDQSGLRIMKRIGVYMVPMTTQGDINAGSLDGGSGRPYPTALAIAMADKSTNKDHIAGESMIVWAEKNYWKPKCFLVQKPKSGWFYEFGVVIYMDGSYSSHTVPIAIDEATGRPYILKYYKQERRNFYSGCSLYRGAASTGGYKKPQWQSVDLGTSYEDEKNGDYTTATAIKRTLEIFCITYNYSLRRDASTQVYASKNKVKMAFTVPTHTWKNFFNDRITATARDGKKKRIFHHVAAHKRKNGSTVNMHTRGLTRFSWGGFNIKIAEVKKGRIPFYSFDVNSEVMTDSEAASRKKGFISGYEVGNIVSGAMEKDLHIPTEDMTTVF